jgi:hypothetical protein
MDLFHSTLITVGNLSLSEFFMISGGEKIEAPNIFEKKFII